MSADALSCVGRHRFLPRYPALLQAPILRSSMITSRRLSVLFLLGSLLLPPAAAVMAAPDVAMQDPVRESHSRQAESELQVRHRGLRGNPGAVPSQDTPPERFSDTPDEAPQRLHARSRLPHPVQAPQNSFQLFTSDGQRLYLTTARLRL